MATIAQLHQIYLAYPTICTDTRKIYKDCLFFALKGDNFDANEFAMQAIANGAAYAIVDNKQLAEHDQLIVVDDVLGTLQALATFHRNQLNIPIIGLTGSNGKTTTKELIKAVLSEKYNVFATSGNLNNHIGVPLSMLSIGSDVEIAIIEMGANHQQEIAFLCEIAQPTHGLITNVGMAHLDGFGGFEGVKKGKAELYTYLKVHDGITFINQDNDYLIAMSQTVGLAKVIYYGKSTNNAISGRLKESDPFISFEWEKEKNIFEGQANLTGTYNFENILAAICIGDFFKLSPAQVNKGLTNYYPTNNRSQLTKTNKNSVICDFYNANPSSMTAALLNLKSLNGDAKMAIIGDMFELGSEAAEQHENIIKLANENKLASIFIGKHFFEFRNHYQGEFFETPTAALNYLKIVNLQDHLILLKGSRGMALEQLLPAL